MLSGLLDPFIGITITHEIEKPAEKVKTVAAPKAEPHCVRRERVDKCARTFAVIQKIRSDTRWSGHRHAGEYDGLARLESPDRKTNIGSSGLVSCRQCKLVLIGWKVAEPIERSSRFVGDGPLDRGSLPRRDAGCELKPGCP